MKKLKGVLVKKVNPDYKMSNEETELIAELMEEGHMVILDRRETGKCI